MLERMDLYWGLPLLSTHKSRHGTQANSAYTVVMAWGESA